MNLLEEYKKCFGRFNYENIDTDTEYGIIVDKKNKEVYLKFQGSVSNQDWVQNFNFRKQLMFHFLKGRFHKPFKTFFFVHNGIYRKWLSVSWAIHNKIDPLLKEGYTLFIHGFSQGGGITITAHEDFFYYLNRNDLDTDSVISFAFAPPTVFSICSSKVFKSRFRNLIIIKNVNDIVPSVPGRLFGYKHYGTIIKIGNWNWNKLLPWKWTKEHLGYKKILEREEK